MARRTLTAVKLLPVIHTTLFYPAPVSATAWWVVVACVLVRGCRLGWRSALQSWTLQHMARRTLTATMLRPGMEISLLFRVPTPGMASRDALACLCGLPLLVTAGWQHLLTQHKSRRIGITKTLPDREQRTLFDLVPMNDASLGLRSACCTSLRLEGWPAQGVISDRCITYTRTAATRPDTKSQLSIVRNVIHITLSFRSRSVWAIHGAVYTG